MNIKAYSADEEITVTATRLPAGTIPLGVPTVGRPRPCLDEFCDEGMPQEPVLNSMPKWQPIPLQAKYDNDPLTVWKLFDWFKSAAHDLWGQIVDISSSAHFCRQNKTVTEVFEYDTNGRVVRKERQIDGLEFGYNCEK